MSETFIFMVVIGFTSGSYDNMEYLGNFTSCQVADEYIAEHMPEVKESKCLDEDFIDFDENLVRNYIK